MVVAASSLLRLLLFSENLIKVSNSRKIPVKLVAEKQQVLLICAVTIETMRY